MSRDSPFALRIAVLGALYFVQGLPFGVQVTVLPVLLRRLDISLESIGFAGALTLPWMLKVLWAPIVEAYYLPRLGRRRTWILPLTLALVGLALTASALPPSRRLAELLACLLAMNLATATQDVAVDGWAVDLLRPHELGPGNGAQVVGYKLGMLSTGGLLFMFLPQLGWWGFCLAIAAVCAGVFVLVALLGERGSADHRPVEGLREVGRALATAARAPGMIWILLFIGTYKLGESAADAMFKPFLVDAGFTDAQIARWVGVYGTIGSVLGSLAGAFVARALPRLRAVAITAALRVLPMLAQAALAFGLASPAGVIAVTIAEHFFGGALTTAMFAFMMHHVDRRIGGTHFTAFATAEALGKYPAGLLSGVLAASFGYGGVFLGGAALSIAFLGWIGPLQRTRTSVPGA